MKHTTTILFSTMMALTTTGVFAEEIITPSEEIGVKEEVKTEKPTAIIKGDKKTLGGIVSRAKKIRERKGKVEDKAVTPDGPVELNITLKLDVGTFRISTDVSEILTGIGYLMFENDFYSVLDSLESQSSSNDFRDKISEFALYNFEIKNGKPTNERPKFKTTRITPNEMISYLIVIYDSTKDVFAMSGTREYKCMWNPRLQTMQQYISFTVNDYKNLAMIQLNGEEEMNDNRPLEDTENIPPVEDEE